MLWCGVDARERLRRYLEQRRELGESELVLDGMSVDDVMAMIGARGTARVPRASRGPVSAMTPPEQPSAPPRTDAATPTPVPTPVPMPSAEPPPVADAPVSPPPVPERRFDADASADWRTTLRQADEPRAGAMPAGVPAVPSRAAVLPPWLAALGLPPGFAAGSPLTAISGDDRNARANSLDAIGALIRSCTACSLHKAARNAVPGEGDPQAEFVCVGEAPGASEDEQGVPFVGEAGQLLIKILSAIQLTRESVFICNVLKHRPPANRDPLPDEVAACQPFLRQQLAVVKPRVILALGRFAAQTLLNTTTPIGKLRGQVHEYHGIPVIVTYHPAALLRNAAWKRPTWEDVKLARRILDASRAASS